LGLLRRHVGGRARHRPGALGRRARDAEVHYDHPAGTGEHDVFGLDVAVDEACFVDRLEAREELRADRLRVGGVERRVLSELVEQGPAVDVLHGDQLATLDLDQVVDSADVWRRDLARDADLLAQKLEPARVCKELGAEGLEGHLDPKFEIEGAPDLAHAAASELGQDAEALPGHLPRPDVTSPRRHIEGLALAFGAGHQVRTDAVLRHIDSRSSAEV
jgi:hypothetical protein